MKLFVAAAFVLHLSNSLTFGICSVDQEKSLLEEIRTKLLLIEELVQKRTESCKTKQIPPCPTTTKMTTTTTSTTSKPPTTKDQQEQSCLPPYTMDSATEICYRIYGVYKTWIEARNYCANQGERLLVLDDRKKFDRFGDILKPWTESTRALQVGFKYSEKDGKFLWLNGKNIESYQWGEDQPNRDGEMCGAIGLDWGGSPFMLHDAPCNTESHYFICEKEG